MLLSASKVLILVVVDNGLVLYLLKRRPMHLVVLILVVVDNGLVPFEEFKNRVKTICLNPCCSGQWSRT